MKKNHTSNISAIQAAKLVTSNHDEGGVALPQTSDDERNGIVRVPVSSVRRLLGTNWETELDGNPIEPPINRAGELALKPAWRQALAQKQEKGLIKAQYGNGQAIDKDSVLALDKKGLERIAKKKITSREARRLLGESDNLSAPLNHAREEAILTTAKDLEEGLGPHWRERFNNSCIVYHEGADGGVNINSFPLIDIARPQRRFRMGV